MKKGIFRYGWRIGLGYLGWRLSNIMRTKAVYGENPQWSNQLEALLVFEKFDVQEQPFSSNCMATIGGIEVWTANHPYASFSRYPDAFEARHKGNVLPTRFVVYLAERKCIEQGIKLDV